MHGYFCIRRKYNKLTYCVCMPYYLRKEANIYLYVKRRNIPKKTSALKK